MSILNLDHLLNLSYIIYMDINYILECIILTLACFVFFWAALIVRKPKFVFIIILALSIFISILKTGIFKLQEEDVFSLPEIKKFEIVTGCTVDTAYFVEDLRRERDKTLVEYDSTGTKIGYRHIPGISSIKLLKPKPEVKKPKK